MQIRPDDFGIHNGFAENFKEAGKIDVDIGAARVAPVPIPGPYCLVKTRIAVDVGIGERVVRSWALQVHLLDYCHDGRKTLSRVLKTAPPCWTSRPLGVR